MDNATYFKLVNERDQAQRGVKELEAEIERLREDCNLYRSAARMHNAEREVWARAKAELMEMVGLRYGGDDEPLLETVLDEVRKALTTAKNA